MVKLSPCYWCEKRYPGCHDHCDGYKVWKAEMEKNRTIENEVKHKEAEGRKVDIDRIFRIRKAKGG